MTTPTRRGKNFQQLVEDAKSRIQEISCDEYCQMRESGQPMVVLDVREADSYEQGHVDGAINLPRGLIELEIDEVVPDQDTLIVTVCGGGSRSALAADTLQAMGYSNVRSLAAGYKGYCKRK